MVMKSAITMANTGRLIKNFAYLFVQLLPGHFFPFHSLADGDFALAFDDDHVVHGEPAGDDGVIAVSASDLNGFLRDFIIHDDIYHVLIEERDERLRRDQDAVLRNLRVGDDGAVHPRHKKAVRICKFRLHGELPAGEAGVHLDDRRSFRLLPHLSTPFPFLAISKYSVSDISNCTYTGSVEEMVTRGVFPAVE